MPIYEYRCKKCGVISEFFVIKLFKIVIPAANELKTIIESYRSKHWKKYNLNSIFCLLSRIQYRKKIILF